MFFDVNNIELFSRAVQQVAGGYRGATVSASAAAIPVQGGYRGGAVLPVAGGYRGFAAAGGGYRGAEYYENSGLDTVPLYQVERGHRHRSHDYY